MVFEDEEIQIHFRNICSSGKLTEKVRVSRMIKGLKNRVKQKKRM